MKIYRIDREKRRREVLSGVGAYLNGGRWNFPGHHVVYAAGSRSLAILEMLVHLDLTRHLQNDRIMVEIDIPDDFIRYFHPGSGFEWRKFPYGPETQSVWKRQNDGDLMILKLPSAIVPEEYNYLLNPIHPQFYRIAVVEVWALDLDVRLV